MSKIYKREKYLSQIRGFYSTCDLVKVLTGIRRCGKSSIMELIAKELVKENGVKPENIVFISLERRGFMSIKTPEQLGDYIDSKFKGIKGTKYLFIDEIQRVKGFETLVEGYRSEKEYSIFITGSNSYLLSGELMTYLTGRYISFEIGTLTFDEYIGMKKFFKKEVNSNLHVEFEKYIIEGGFPETVLINDEFNKKIYAKHVVDEIFEKDIRKNKKIKNKELFNTIQTYIINNFGSKTSIGSLCDYLSKTRKERIKKDTVYRYLNILENAKIISKCKRFDLKSKKSINGNEKYYLTDLSLYFCTNVDARVNYGPVLENIVYNYAKSKRYELSIGEIGNLEVDFILRNVYNEYCYVQVAKNLYNGYNSMIEGSPTEEREYRSLEKIPDNYPKYVLTMDYLMQHRSGIKHCDIVDFISKNKEFIIRD